MKGTSRTTGQEQQLNQHIAHKLRSLLKLYGITVTELARVAGYERAAIHRLLNGKHGCRLIALYRLSKHYHVPMSFFIPEEEEVTDTDSMPYNILVDAAPMTRNAIKQINRLSAVDKKALIGLLQEPHLPLLLQVTHLLGKAESSKQERLLLAMEAILTDSETTP